jgi:hypothetical protein
VTKRAILSVLNAGALVVALVFNGLAAGMPLNGMDTGELSDLYPNLFVPIGLTFSIWGLIYLGLLGFVAYGFVRIGDDQPSAVEAIGPWFVVNGLANASWIVAWHWMQVPLSVAIMGVILASLLMMYVRLGIGRRPTSLAETVFVRAPISLYLGWITVATIANVTTLAVDLGAPGFGTVPALLTIGVMAVAVAITAVVLWTRRDVIYALVVMWAFVGIGLKRWGAVDDGSMWVAVGSTVGLVAMATIVVTTLFRAPADGTSTRAVFEGHRRGYLSW